MTAIVLVSVSLYLPRQSILRKITGRGILHLQFSDLTLTTWCVASLIGLLMLLSSLYLGRNLKCLIEWNIFLMLNYFFEI